MLYNKSNPHESSLTGRYRKLSKKDQLVRIVTRNIKRVGRNRDIQDPIGDFLKEYNKLTNGNITNIDQIDEVSLEWIHNLLATSIHEICEEIKRKSKDLLAVQ